MKPIANIAQLVDAIGAGCDPNDKGPIVVTLQLWDGRIVTASYYRREPNERPDLDYYGGNIIVEDELIRPFAELLVREGASFVVETGADDTVCTLKWELQP